MTESTDESIRLPRLAGPVRLGVCLSGGGRTLTNIIRSIESGELHAVVEHVVASSGSCGGIARAENAQVPTSIVQRKMFEDDDSFSEAVIEQLGDVDLIVLAGFLKRLVVPPAWRERVLNIHPSLIPAFCGQGYYGQRVHQAVLDRGAKVTGCTVHFVDNEYDHGPIIAQRCVPVLSDDTAETLSARVFEQECQLYPEAIRLVASGRLRLEGRRVLEDVRYS